MSIYSLEETGRGLTLRAENRYLYSRYNPSSRPRRAAEMVPRFNKCIYFVPSPLLGYGIRELIERIPEDSVILAVEESQEIMALCSGLFLENLGDYAKDKRIVSVRLSDKRSLHKLLYTIGPWRFRRVYRVDLNSGAELNPDFYNEAASFLIEDLMSYWRNRHALGRLGREWIRHIFANLSEVSRGKTDFRSLSSQQIDKIPLVAGAGPSLERSLDFIKQFREHLWILAVDTALPAFLSAGIQPDAAVVLDTQPWNYLDFHNSRSSGIPLIADITAYPGCLSHTGGPCYLFSSDFAELDFLQRLNNEGFREFSIPPLGSVGLAAVEIAEKLSNSEVFLTGLDFAYSPGKSHARGSSFHQWQLSRSHRLEPHPGWDSSLKRPRTKGLDASGRPVDTDEILLGYAALLKDRYSHLHRFYVLEPGGLDVGLPLISLEDAGRVIESRMTTDAGKLIEKRSDGQLAGSINGNADVKKVQSSPVSAGRASEFLNAEIARLNLVISAWEDYAAGEGTADKLVEQLEGMDEIFLDFPDQPPLPKKDDSFLVRGVSRARQLRRYLERLEE